MRTHLITRCRRVAPRVAMFFAAVAAVSLLSAVTAIGAGAAASTTTTTIAAPQVLNGVTVGRAVVTTPGKPTRHLTVDQNAAFMQTWLDASIVSASSLQHQRPPSCLPVSVIRSSMTYTGMTTDMTVFYATDGVTAWVGMPAQSLPIASVTKETWVLPPSSPLTIAAVDGHVTPTANPSQGAPENVEPDKTATTVVCDAATRADTKTAAKDSSSSSSSSTAWVWFVIPIAIVVGGLGIWLFTRSRSRTA